MSFTPSVTAVHLERNVTYVNTGNSGIIGQWFPQYWSEPQYYLENIKLEEAKSSLIIQTTGLYIIYAQVWYIFSLNFNHLPDSSRKLINVELFIYQRSYVMPLPRRTTALKCV